MPKPLPSAADSSEAELASLLARGYLRFRERSRRAAVSCTPDEQIPLDESRASRPDLNGNEAA
jgi:hypothetical protein